MEWLIPANQEYNYKRAFKELNCVDWEQKNNYSVGDRVYIYSTLPLQAIELLVEVIKTDIPVGNEIGDEDYWNDMQAYEEYKRNRKKNRKNVKYVRFKLINYFGDEAILLNDLQENGLKGIIRGARKLYDSKNSVKNWGNYIHERLKDIEEKYIIKRNAQLDFDMEEKIASGIIDQKNYHYTDKLNEKPESIEEKGRVIYKRNKNIAINALGIAGFKCEIDRNHNTFIRRNDDVPYTEPHHLIPMSYQKKFKCSIDIEENIVSLCCNCHKEIHYGKKAKILVGKLYNKRRDLLAKKNINITLQELLSYY